ncbi:MAG: hypothetical protein NTW29_13080 [Bacteroidetes bacterium]|nr:hypothetical protein [Bacteroidota bacterium]
MYKKLAIYLLFTAITRVAIGQQEPIQYFFRQIDNRGYDGDYKAYSVRVFADSSIEVRVYTVPGMTFQPAMQKATYFGRYHQLNDSCIIRYWSSYTEYREMSSGIKLRKRWENKNDSLPALKLNTSARFIIQGLIITFSGWLIPQILRSTAVQVDAMETVFQQWGKSFNRQYFTGIPETRIVYH